MEHDLEQKIKEKLLESLIEHMDDKMASKMKPHHGMAVEVAAPDKEKLAKGLDKAKEILGNHEEPDGDEGLMPIKAPDGDGDEMSDEERLEALLEAEKDDEENEKEKI